MKKRRTVSCGFTVLLVLGITVNRVNILASPQISSANETYRQTFLEVPFIGENLSYTIGFWLFKNAARAHMTFLRTSQGYYESVVDAQTEGVVGFLSRNMQETMKSIMRFDQEKGRFVPLLFQEAIRQGKRERQKTVEFDYDKKVILVTYENTGRKRKTIRKPLPKNDVDDLLSAFYNLRLGCFGKINQGKKVVIKVWVSETPSKISIDFPLPFDNTCSTPCEGTYYAILAMDRNTTHIASKKLIGWLTDDLVPLCGIVEDAYLFGDLYVRLKERSGAYH